MHRSSESRGTPDLDATVSSGWKRCVSWTVGVAAVCAALPATAQEFGSPGQRFRPLFEPQSVTASLQQQPATGGDQTKQDQEKSDDKHPGTSDSRLFGTLPDFLTVENAANVPPLTTRQKYDVTSRFSFDLGQYLFYFGLAGISQAQNADPSYRQGAKGYAKRLGLVFADGTIENFITTAVLPSALHQDPRYFRLGKGNVWYRAGYSVSRIFVTRGDDGHAQFNYSEILGAAMAAAVYNTYHPASDQSVSNTIESWWLQISYDTGFILVREFWPDVVRKFRRHPSARRPR
jgi:hypothetical protein